MSVEESTSKAGEREGRRAAAKRVGANLVMEIARKKRVVNDAGRTRKTGPESDGARRDRAVMPGIDGHEARGGAGERRRRA